MKIPTQTDLDYTPLQKDFEVLFEFDIIKVIPFLKQKMSELRKHQNLRTYLIYILNKLDAEFATHMPKYKELLQSSDQPFSNHQDQIKKLEDSLKNCILISFLLVKSLDASLFNCFDHLMDLIHLSSNFDLINDSIKTLGEYYARVAPSASEKVPRLVHNISMIALHRNLYNKNSLTLVELLSDDYLFKDLMASHPDKIRSFANKDNLTFEFYLNTMDQNSKELATDNIQIELESVKAAYPDTSPYVITKKIIEDKKLPIKADSPLFDALFFRVKLALNFEQYNHRILVIESVIRALKFIAQIRKNHTIANKYESFIFQSTDLTPNFEEILDLLKLKATPQIHERVFKFLTYFISKHNHQSYREFFTTRLVHSETLSLTYRDLTAIEIKKVGDDLSNPSNVVLNVKTLVFPKESVLYPKALKSAVILFKKAIEELYMDDRRKVLLVEVDNLSHLISTTMSIVTQSSFKNFFLFPKKIMTNAMQLIELVMFHKDFVREFNIIETLIESTDNLMNLLNKEEKCYERNGNTWSLLEQKQHIELLNSMLDLLSNYFKPYSRYNGRPEMAATLARKIVESQILKNANIYLQKPDAHANILKPIIKLTSEVCKESQTLVPRIIDLGLMDTLMKATKEKIISNEDMPEALSLVSNFCLQEAGRTVERKYKLIELIFEIFSKPDFAKLNAAWMASEGNFTKKTTLIGRIDYDLIYITKYIDVYSGYVSEGIFKTAEGLINEYEKFMKDFKDLKKSEVEEGKPDPNLEALTADFTNLFNRLRNFTLLYIRYIRDGRVRSMIFKKGGFAQILNLFSINLVYSQTLDPSLKVLEAFSNFINQELENQDQNFISMLEKGAGQEVDKIDQTFGTLKDLPDFSKIVDFNFIGSLSDKTSIIKVLYNFNTKAYEIQSFFRSLGLLVNILKSYISYRPKIPYFEKINHLYTAYYTHSVKYTLQLAEKQNDTKDLEDSTKSTIAMLKFTDGLGPYHSWLNYLKYIYDIHHYQDIISPEGVECKPLVNITLSNIKLIKELGEIPTSNADAQRLWIKKFKVILESIDFLLENENYKPNSYPSYLPAFCFALLENSAYEIFAGKLISFVEFAAKRLGSLKDLKDYSLQELKEIPWIFSTLQLGTNLLNKLFLATSDFSTVTKLNGKVLNPGEVSEYINAVWINHIKIMKGFLSEVCSISQILKPALVKFEKSVLAVQEKKKAEAKEKAEKKDQEKTEQLSVEDEAAQKAKNLEKFKEEVYFNNYNMGLKSLRSFSILFFKSLSRVFSKTSIYSSPSKPVPAQKKTTNNAYGSPAVSPVVQSIIAQVSSMGIETRIVEIAVNRVQYLNVESVLEYCLSHPELMDMVESQPAPKKEEAQETISLSSSSLQKISDEEFNTILLKEAEELGQNFISNLFGYEGFEKTIIKFIRRSLEFHQKNKKNTYAQHVSVMVLKLFKHTLNKYFNIKFVSSFKIPLGLDKDFGTEVISIYTSHQDSPLAKLKGLEIALAYFMKLKRFIPNIEKKIIRSDFLQEVMAFYDQFISKQDDFLSMPKESRAPFETSIRVITQSFMKLFSSIALARLKPEPKSKESKPEELLFAEPSSSDPNQESKPKETVENQPAKRKSSIITRKSAMELAISILSSICNLEDKDEQFSLMSQKALQNSISLVSSLLKESPDAVKVFLKNKGINELLRLKSNLVFSLTEFINDFAAIVMSLVEDNTLILASIETKIKNYISSQSAKVKQIPLNSFAQFFKDEYRKYPKLIFEAVSRLCIIYANDPDPKKADLNTTLRNRFIKLKADISLQKFHTLKKASKPGELDVSEPVVYTPPQNTLNILQTLVESAVIDMNTLIVKTSKNEASTEPLFPYDTIVKVLMLISTRHPSLLPHILSINCAPLFKKEDSEVLIFKELSSRSNLSFISYYIRIMHLFTLDKMRYFLLEALSTQNYLITLPEGESATLSSQISKEVLLEIEQILKEELEKPDFLETRDSCQKISSISSLLCNIVSHRDFLKQVMANYQKEQPTLIKLFTESFKRLRLKNYYKLENVLPFIHEIFSVLIQLYNYAIINYETFSTKTEKYLEINILAKKNINRMADIIKQGTDRAEDPNLQQDLYGSGNRFNRFDRAMFGRDDDEFDDDGWGGRNVFRYNQGNRAAPLGRAFRRFDDVQIQDRESSIGDSDIMPGEFLEIEEASVSSENQGGQIVIEGEEDLYGPELVDGMDHPEFEIVENQIENLGEESKENVNVLKLTNQVQPNPATYNYLSEINGKIQEFVIPDPELRDINARFTQLSLALGKTADSSNTIDNPTFYSNKVENSADLYTTIYNQLSFDITRNDGHPQHGGLNDPIYTIERRLHEARNTILRIEEGGGYRQERHHLNLEPERNFGLFSQNQRNQEQAQANLEASNFASALIQNCQCEIPNPPAEEKKEEKPEEKSKPNTKSSTKETFGKILSDFFVSNPVQAGNQQPSSNTLNLGPNTFGLSLNLSSNPGSGNNLPGGPLISLDSNNQSSTLNLVPPSIENVNTSSSEEKKEEPNNEVPKIEEPKAEDSKLEQPKQEETTIIPSTQPEEQKIDPQQTQSLTINDPVSAQTEIKQPETQPESTLSQPGEIEFTPQSGFPLKDYGITPKFLVDNGIDLEIFDMLPYEEQEELVFSLLDSNPPVPQTTTQSQPQVQTTTTTTSNQPSSPRLLIEGSTNINSTGSVTQNTTQAQPQAQTTTQQQQQGGQQQTQPQAQAQPAFEGIDPELLANLDQLPEDLRLDILRQQNALMTAHLTGENPAPTNPTGEMDQATFLETLDRGLRQEILATLDQGIIDTLPPHLQAEALMLQDNRINRFENEGLIPPRQEPTDPPINFLETKIKKEEKIDPNMRKALLKSDEKLIESLLKLIYLEKSKFLQFPFGILNALAQNPSNEFHIFDTLMFLLKNDDFVARKEKDDSETFPPNALFEPTRIVTDRDSVYSQVSSNILYLLYLLTDTRSDYFLESSKNDDDIDDLPPPDLERHTSLPSIQNLKSELKIQDTQPLFDLLKFCTKSAVTKSNVNVILLINIIENICKNPKIFKAVYEEDSEEVKPKPEEESKDDKAPKKTEPKVEKEEVLICRYLLDEESVSSFCHLLYSEQLSNTLIQKLSFIIGVFCQEKNNLDIFIRVMKNIMYKVSLESNKFLEEKLVHLKKLFKTKENQDLEEEQTRNLLNEIIGKFSNQLPILRIAKIIKFLYENTVKYLRHKNKEDKKKQQQQQNKPEGNIDPNAPVKAPRKNSLKDEIFLKTKEQILTSIESIMLDDNLNNFWINVSEVVYYINENMTHSWDAQNLLNNRVRPIIESFFIIQRILSDEEYTEYKVQTTKTKASIAEFVTTDEVLEIPSINRGFSEVKTTKLTPQELFQFICEKNKKVINIMIKNDFSLLNDSMAIIAKKVPKILDFEIRRMYFRKELSKMAAHGSIQLRVKRSNIMENSFSQLYPRHSEDLKRKIHVQFIGEEGMDAGGVSREWFLELSKQVFNPNYNLFVMAPNGNTFQPSLISDGENLNYFKFVGKFIAKALFDGQLLECYFTRAFYKHILGQPLSYHDLEDFEPDYYKSLKWMLENPINDADLGTTFSFEKNKFGQTIIEDLIPNGRNVLVTDENKREFVNLICKAKMAAGIKAQIESFLSGFFEIIPRSMISIFDSKELELLISGLPDIDINDLRENTEYHGFEPNSNIIKWFWEILEEMDTTQRANMLQFVTGTSKVPLDGFKALRGISGPQKFQIHRAGGLENLPTGHTCFNQIDIPEYKSKEQLKSKLLLAVMEGKEGFGFA